MAIDINKEEQKRLFTELSANLDAVKRKQVDLTLKHPVMFKTAIKVKFLNLLNFSKNDLVLDMGTLDGSYLRYVNSRFGCKGVGIDICRKCIEYLKRFDKGNKYLVCDAEKLKFKEETFNGLITYALVEHLSNPRRCISEMYRVLKKGGKVAVSVVYKDDYFGLSGLYHFFTPKKWEKQIAKSGHSYDRLLTFKQYIELLKKQGFKILKIRHYGFFFYPFHDWYLFPFFKNLLTNPKRTKGNKKGKGKIDSTDGAGGVSGLIKIYSKLFLPVLGIFFFLEKILNKLGCGYMTYLILEKSK